MSDWREAFKVGDAVEYRDLDTWVRAKVVSKTRSGHICVRTEGAKVVSKTRSGHICVRTEGGHEFSGVGKRSIRKRDGA